MELNMNLLKEFSAIARNAPVTKPAQSTVSGTVAIQGDPPKTYVKLDGSDNLTPVSTTIQVEDGDRVMVSISGHVATITGNVTAPAATRVGMEMTQNGLEIGLLDKKTGKITGFHALIDNVGFHIVDGDNNKLSSHKLAELILGGSNASIVKFCNGKGIIKYITDTLVLSSETAVGFRQPQTGSNRAEVVAKKAANSTNPQAGLQVIRNNTTVASVIASDSGVNITTTGNRKFKVNGNEITFPIIISGSVKSTRTIVTKQMKTIEVKITALPDGYTLAGIREIRTNHGNLCRLTQFATHPSKKIISATYVNTGNNDLSVTVYMEWFALRSGSTNYGHTSDNTTIVWTGESGFESDDIILDDDYYTDL